jgi:hypothetical protein
MPRETISRLAGSLYSCWADRFDDEDDYDSMVDAILVLWHWAINDWWNYD